MRLVGETLCEYAVMKEENQERTYLERERRDEVNLPRLEFERPLPVSVDLDSQ